MKFVVIIAIVVVALIGVMIPGVFANSDSREIYIMPGSNQDECWILSECYDSKHSSITNLLGGNDVFIDDISPGDEITFINDDNVTHSIRIDSNCGYTEFRSGHIQPGESVIFTARFPGETTFYDELYPRNIGLLKIELDENTPLTVYTNMSVKKYNDEITLFFRIPTQFQNGGNVEIKLFDQNNIIVEEGTTAAVFSRNIYPCFNDQIPGGFYSFSTASDWQNGKYNLKAVYDGFESETYFTVDNNIPSEIGNVSFTIDKNEYQQGDKIRVEGIVNPIVEKPSKAYLNGQVTYPDGSNLRGINIDFDPIDGTFDFEVDTTTEYHWTVDGQYKIILKYDESNSFTTFSFMTKTDSEIITPEAIVESAPKLQNSGIASFVDQTKDPQHYIDRYNNEPKYKEWFDENYPQYISIYEAVGLPEPFLPMTNPTPIDPCTTSSGMSDASTYECQKANAYSKLYTNNKQPSGYLALQDQESKNQRSESMCARGMELVGDTCQLIETKIKESEGGGCLIATATYGTELAPQVQLLREIRDNNLLNTESGSAFMKTFNNIYYSFSPTIADWERESPVFKEAVKLAITPMITSLSLMENAESESEVLGIGISLIALNLAMYLGVPAVVIIGIRKRF